MLSHGAGERVVTMSKPSQATPPNDVDKARPRLALRPKEACIALSIGPRLLWSMTNRGEVPHVRMGRAVVYPVDELRRWLSEQAQKKGGRR